MLFFDTTWEAFTLQAYLKTQEQIHTYTSNTKKTQGNQNGLVCSWFQKVHSGPQYSYLLLLLEFPTKRNVYEYYLVMFIVQIFFKSKKTTFSWLENFHFRQFLLVKIMYYIYTRSSNSALLKGQKNFRKKIFLTEFPFFAISKMTKNQFLN